jgi:hypothetical protein
MSHDRHSGFRLGGQLVRAVIAALWPTTTTQQIATWAPAKVKDSHYTTLDPDGMATGARRRSADGPRCDLRPERATHPADATFDQMTAVTKALLNGDEDALDVLKRGVRTKTQELLPHRHP